METGSEIRSRVVSIGTAVPEYRTGQNTILDFMKNAYDEPTASRKLDALFYHSGIGSRFSVVPDFSNQQTRELFPEDQKIPYLNERVEVYRKKALPLAIKAIHSCASNLNAKVENIGVTHLITVSCTGLYAPGLDADILENLKLPFDTFHTSLNFLGCNAAFPALKIADSFVRSQPDAKVLIVCVELCTIHFQPKNDNDNLLSNTIFGDGAAAVMVTSDQYAQKSKLNGLTLKGFHSALLSSGKDLMGWNLTQRNFEMKLNAGLPAFIGRELLDLMAQISIKFGISLSEVNRWAIHPGGKKILEAVQKELCFNNNELSHSYEVLKEYGNMSSPTILFVLAGILNGSVKAGDVVFAMGFGPGISIESLVATYEEV
jgi:predicted naringenin-chalcone synthase